MAPRKKIGRPPGSRNKTAPARKAATRSLRSAPTTRLPRRAAGTASAQRRQRSDSVRALIAATEQRLAALIGALPAAIAAALKTKRGTSATRKAKPSRRTRAPHGNSAQPEQQRPLAA